jgi:hypothetical protein
MPTNKERAGKCVPEEGPYEAAARAANAEPGLRWAATDDVGSSRARNMEHAAAKIVVMVATRAPAAPA